MKDIITFPVVGTIFSEGGLLMARLLNEGASLKLVLEPTNEKDPDAIMVMAFEDEHIGYVPNKGVSCNVCWSHIAPEDQHCKSCGANWEHFVKGGLATRLKNSGVFKKTHACFVEAMDKENEYCVVTAKLVTE